MSFISFTACARLFVLGLALTGIGASTALAQDDGRQQSAPTTQQSNAQTFQVSGVDPSQGAYTGQVTLTQRANGAVEVSRDVLFENGQREQQRGVGSQRGQEIRAQLRADNAQGGLADLGNAPQQGPVVARITAQVDPAGTIQASVMDASGEISREQGAQSLPSTGQTGQTLPATGQTSPATGQTLPSTGELPAQTLPATGQVANSGGSAQSLPAQTLPATGQVANSNGSSNQAGSTGQAGSGSTAQSLPSLGETLPSQGGVSNQSAQSRPTTQAPGAAPSR